MRADPGEQTDVAAEHPDVVNDMAAAFDKWWTDVKPMLVNEGATGPRINPFKEMFWKQFGGGPTAQELELMDPNRPFGQRPKGKGKKK